MKIFLALALVAGSVAAQQLPTQNEQYNYGESRDVHNYIEGIADRVPDGATGPGVVYTQRAVGKIISIGSAVFETFPVGVVGGVCITVPGGFGLPNLSGSPMYKKQAAEARLQCQTVFEQRLKGYSFTVQYHSIQMQGFSRRMPRVGEDAEIIIRSVFYAGN